MNGALGGVLVLACLLLGGCGGDDDGESAACREGCVATVEADCDNGPASQASCESDCRALESGSCAAEYKALQTCAEGQKVSCSAQGLPTVSACANETAAFVSCIN